MCRMSSGMLEPVRPRKDVSAVVRRVDVVRGSIGGVFGGLFAGVGVRRVGTRSWRWR